MFPTCQERDIMSVESLPKYEHVKLTLRLSAFHVYACAFGNATGVGNILNQKPACLGANRYCRLYKGEQNSGKTSSETSSPQVRNFAYDIAYEFAYES